VLALVNTIKEREWDSTPAVHAKTCAHLCICSPEIPSQDFSHFNLASLALENPESHNLIILKWPYR